MLYFGLNVPLPLSYAASQWLLQKRLSLYKMKAPTCCKIKYCGLIVLYFDFLYISAYKCNLKP